MLHKIAQVIIMQVDRQLMAAVRIMVVQEAIINNIEVEH